MAFPYPTPHKPLQHQVLCNMDEDYFLSKLSKVRSKRQTDDRRLERSHDKNILSSWRPFKQYSLSETHTGSIVLFASDSLQQHPRPQFAWLLLTTPNKQRGLIGIMATTFSYENVKNNSPYCIGVATAAIINIGCNLAVKFSFTAPTTLL